MSIKPLRDLLYVLPFEELSMIGKIERPKNARQLVNQGIVKYRGPLTSGHIRVGDHVLFNGYEGDDMMVEGEGRLLLIPEESIDCVLLTGENYLLTVEQCKLGIRRAGGEVAAMTRDVHEAMLIDTIVARVCEHLDFRFTESEVRF